jgi:hypothetical protein
MHRIRLHACHHGHGERISWLDRNAISFKVREDFFGSISDWSDVFQRGLEDVVDVNLRDPSNGRVDYPSDEVRSKETILARRKAEKNLDVFWRSVDVAFKNKTGLANHAALRKLLNEGGPMRRTAAWVHPAAFAVQKLQGSAWDFSSLATFNVSTNIQFNAPHPENVMPLSLARRCGRRLWRRYGLDGTMFVSVE